MTIKGPTRTAILVAVPLVALLALILFGYQREANRRAQYFTRRNLRVLSVLAQQTESAVAAMQRALGAAVRAAGEGQKVLLDRQEAGVSPGDSGDTASTCEFDRALGATLELVPGMRLLPAGDGPECAEACLTVWPRLASAPQTSLAQRHRVLHREVDGSEPKDSALILCHPKPLGELARAAKSGSCLRALDKPSVCVAVELSFLLESRIADGPLDGLNVFLADQTGRVLYQRGSAALNIVSLANGAQTNAAAGGKTEKPAKEADASDAARRGLPAIADLQTMTGIETVSVDGFTVALMSQPLRIAARGGADDSVWVLGVLAPQGGVNAQASVSFAAVAAIPLVILFGLMVTPLMKWASLGPREGLSRWTVVGMAGGLIGGAALATLLGLGWYAYAGFTYSADEELGRLSATVHRHVADELRAIDATLTSFIAERQSTAESSRPAKDRYAICTGVLSPYGHCRADGPETQRRVERLRPALRRYPHFEMLTLTHSNGLQYEKWATRRTTTPMISMTEMSTFRDARDDHGIEVPGEGPAPASRLALNVTVSPNTGETLVVASRAMPEGDDRGVAMLVSHMVSLVGPVVPPDSGFAVIENHGRVLFHSIAGRRLYENFYAEAQDDDDLRAAIHARHAATLDLTYHGRAVRAAVRPLAGTPWSVIVYRDKEILRTLSLEAAATAGMGFVGLFLLVALSIAILAVALRPAVAEIPWPDPRRAPRYAAASCALAVLAVWLGWALHAFAPADRLLAALLAPPLALVLAALNLVDLAKLTRWRRGTLLAGALLLAGAAASISWFNGGMATVLVALGAGLQGFATRLAAGDQARPRRTWYLPAYVAMSALLLLNLAVLPAVALIGDAADLIAETYSRRRQLALAEALSVHAAELRERYGAIDGNDALFESLMQRGWDVPVLAAFAPSADDAAGPALLVEAGLAHRIAHWLLPACTDAPCAAGRYHPQPDGADWCALSLRHFSAPLQRMLPIYSQEALEVRYGSFESASDCAWSISAANAAAPFAVPDPRWQAHPSVAESPVTNSLAPPAYHLRLPRGATRLLALVLLAAILAAVALWLLYLLIGRLFGLPEPEAMPLPQDIEVGRGVVLEHASLGDPPGPGFHIVDLAELAGPEALPSTIRDFGEHLIVRHLERCLEPAWGEAGLTWLEGLARRRAPALTLETNRDVSDYFEEPPSPDPAAAPAAASRRSERWAHLLARFALQPAAKPAAGACADAGDWQRDLDDECRWTPRLRGIAAELRDAGRPPAGGREAVIGAVGERAEAHYRSIWCGMTDEERLVLNHLARHGFVSPRSWRIVRRLGERGLVRRDPALRLMNESFTRFVARAEDRATLKGWQHAAGTTTWEWVRTGLAAAVVVAAIVMYLTRPDSLSTWVTFVTAIATLGAKATDVLGFFQVPRRDAKT